MEYKCSGCDFTSILKSNTERHIDKITQCNDMEIENIPVNTLCEYCKKTYATVPSLTRHIKTCKVKKINQDEEIRKLKEELAIAKALAKKPQTINNNNQTNINIQLSAWNDPKLPDNIEEYYMKAVKKVFLAVPTLIKAIHFNTDHPENHNICIKNARNKVAKVYNGKEWESMDEDDLIRSLIDDYEKTLEDYSDEKNLDYSAKIREIKDRDLEEIVYNDLHNIVKCTIYDRNHMVKAKN
jgi:hypothetical protein